MTCKEITVEEFNRICGTSNIYFSNGCTFDEETDNLIAFSWYASVTSEVEK